ncbi:MAG: RNA methyltransferase [Candidatus Omnitrophica bacterium]|nr:RNA methyltransferase [Candidatus Omnitrophota bacterium]
MERLRAAPESVRTLYIEQGTDASDVVREAKRVGLRFVSVPKADFARQVGKVHAQGVFAEVEEFRYAGLETLLQKSSDRPVLFFLDRITDPQNLGNILRTAACFGGIALILPKHDSAEVNETVLRVACGGENYAPVARVTNLATACEQAKGAGYWIAAAAAEGGTPLPGADLPFPIGFLLGSEGEGLRPGLAKHTDLSVTLPMPGAGLSFNVATAAALIAYEVTCRRKEPEKCRKEKTKS